MLVKVKKDKTLDLVVELDLDSKVVKCHYTEDFQREDSQISSLRSMFSINVDRLNIFENGTVVTPELLLETRVISKVLDGVKILGNGTIDKSLTVQGCKFSKSAAEKIEAAGGKVEVI